VKGEIDRAEEAHQSWVISGFPRTKVQAISLQRLKVIPDKFIHLNVKANTAVNHIKQKAYDRNPQLYGEELDNTASQIYSDYNMNVNAVRDSFKQFIFEYNVQSDDEADKKVADVTKDLARMLRLRYKSDAPRRPPRVILLGPPGSSRSTQSQILADQFGLVNVSPMELLKQEAEKNPGVKVKVRDALEKGEAIPDEIVLRLVDARLRQSDCRVNGWVLDGFPANEAQVNLLKAMRIKPSLVVIFEQPVEESIRRLGNKRLDPVTGHSYNVELKPPKSELVNARLIQSKEDSEANVRKRYVAWNANISTLEEAFKNVILSCPSDKMTESITDQIADAIQNPVF
jgi:adenylate kinase